MFKLNKNNENLEKIQENPFKLEKEMQTLTENNLQQLFNLEFIKTEFSIENYRFDTLAFDEENKSFVIIEYKRDAKHTDVFVQGMSYLNVLLNNIDSFIVEYNETLNKNLRRKDIDKTQSRVILVAENFTQKQKEAINFKNFPIELWEVTKYENKIIEYQNVNIKTTKAKIEDLGINEITQKITKEIKVYEEQDHLNKTSEKLQEMYLDLKDKILDIDSDISIVPRKQYIAFKGSRNIVDIEFQKSKLCVFINLKNGKLNDPKNIAQNLIREDGSIKGHFGNGDYEVHMKASDDNLEFVTYLMDLIKQSYRVNR